MDENNEEKPKRSGTVEWSFSFEELGEKISEFVKSATDGEGAELKTGHFSTPLDAAASAKVRIDLSVGEAKVHPVSDASANLLEADLTYVGEIELTSEGDAEKTVRLRQRAGASEWVRGASGWFNNRQPLRWDIGLTPKIPVNLDLHCGAGRAEFDLNALKLTGLNVNSGAGEIIVSLPVGEYEVRISGGVGRTVLSIPEGAFVQLTMSSGAGEVNLNIAQGASVNAKISGGVGATNVRVGEGAAVRLEGRTGIGDIKVGGLLKRISATGGEFWDKGGVWKPPTSKMPNARLSSTSTAASARSRSVK